MSIVYEETRWGFRYGPLLIERLASNDGRDRRKGWVALSVTHDNGDSIQVLGTREGIKVTMRAHVREETR
jgi:hypothetical protein